MSKMLRLVRQISFGLTLRNVFKQPRIMIHRLRLSLASLNPRSIKIHLFILSKVPKARSSASIQQPGMICRLSLSSVDITSK